MYMPSLFTDTFFDDFMSFPLEKSQTRKVQDKLLMRTDIKETESGYQLEMELPGFTKNDLNVKLEDGYLTVTATRTSSTDNTNDETAKDRYIHRERFSGTYVRRFFVGKYVSQADMKARFENGILTLNFPKEDTRKIEEAKYIAIEG